MIMVAAACIMCRVPGMSSSTDISLSLRIKEFPLLARHVQTEIFKSSVCRSGRVIRTVPTAVVHHGMHTQMNSSYRWMLSLRFF